MSNILYRWSWFRLPNLFIVGTTQYVLYFLFVRPSLLTQDLQPRFTPSLFFLLVIVTLVITITGYMINDYFDADIDQINRPNKTSYTALLGKNKVIWVYVILIIVGFIISIFISIQSRFTEYLWIYPLAITLLYLYSRYLKVHPFLGNLVVSLFCAGVIYIVYFIEIDGLSALQINFEIKYSALALLFIFYCLFAVLSNYIRELIKDLEDATGDQHYGLRTFPIYAGKLNTYVFISLLSFFLIILVAFWLFNDEVSITWINRIYVAITIIIPLLLINYQLYRSNPNYHLLSRWSKWVMLAGLINLLFYQNSFQCL